MKIDRRIRKAFKTRGTVAGSLLINIAYALYNGVLGFMAHSLWFAVLCIYYVMLGVMRFLAIACSSNRGIGAEERPGILLKVFGSLLVLLSGILACANYISLSENIASKYDTIVMISIATYTFYRIAITVVRAVKKKKESTKFSDLIGTINQADTAVSVFTLQRSMLVSFGNGEDPGAHGMNVLTGTAVCLFVFFLGVRFMILARNSNTQQKKGKTLWQNQN